ncbi:hypothetical protein KC320_g690 [Hortaea werneckii]|nr:hypothetical protein KC320_g690 [Hortaea werneckii]
MNPSKNLDPDCPPMSQNGSSPQPDSVMRDKGKGRADFGVIGQEREMLRQQRESREDTSTGPLNAATGALALSGGRGRPRNVFEGNQSFGAQPHGTQDAAGNYGHYEFTTPTPYRGLGNFDFSTLDLSDRHASAVPVNQWDLDGRNAQLLGPGSRKRDSSTDTVKTIHNAADAQSYGPAVHAEPEIIFPGRNSAARQAQRQSSAPRSGGQTFSTPRPTSSALRPYSDSPRTKSNKNVSFVSAVRVVPTIYPLPMPYLPQGQPNAAAQSSVPRALLQTPPQGLPRSNQGPAAWSSNSGPVTPAAEMQQLLAITQRRIIENQELIAKVHKSKEASLQLIANLRQKTSAQWDRVGSLEHTKKALEEKIEILMGTVNLMNVDRIRAERASREASSGTNAGPQRQGSAGYTPNPQSGAAPATGSGGRWGYQGPPRGGDNARQHPTAAAGRWTGSGGRPASHRPFQGGGRAPHHPTVGAAPWTVGGGPSASQRPHRGAGTMPRYQGHGGMSIDMPGRGDDVFAPGPGVPREMPKPETASFEQKGYPELIRAITMKTEACSRGYYKSDIPPTANTAHVQEVVRLAQVHLDSKGQAKVQLEDPAMRQALITGLLNRWIAENIWSDDILSHFPGNTLSRVFLDAWTQERNARMDINVANHLPYRLTLATTRMNLAKTLMGLPGFWKWQQDYTTELTGKMVMQFLPLMTPMLVDQAYPLLQKAINEALKTALRMRAEPAFFEVTHYRYGSRFDHTFMVHRNDELIGIDCTQQPSPYVVRMTMAPEIVQKNYNGGNELTIDTLQKPEVWLCDRKTHLR